MASIHLVRPGLPFLAIYTIHSWYLVTPGHLTVTWSPDGDPVTWSQSSLLTVGDEGEEVRMSGEGVRPLLRRSGLSSVALLLLLLLLLILLLLLLLMLFLLMLLLMLML